MSTNAKDLTTVDDVLAYLKDVTNPTQPVQDLLQRLVTSASFFIQTHLNRDFKSQSYTERRNGTGGVLMLFSNYPVTAVSSVVIDGMDIPVGNAAQPGYAFSETTLYLTGGYRFTRNIQNVQIEYTAGYAEIPSDVAQICIDLVCRKWKERDRIGINSKTLGQGETIVFAKTDLTDEFKSLLRQYQKVVPV